jgi:hypothetical protein
MDGMMGMDMSNMFTPTNKKVAHLFWYFVAAVVGILTFRRVVDRMRVRQMYVQVPRKTARAGTDNTAAKEISSSDLVRYPADLKMPSNNFTIPPSPSVENSPTRNCGLAPANSPDSLLLRHWGESCYS